MNRVGIVSITEIFTVLVLIIFTNNCGIPIKHSKTDGNLNCIRDSRMELVVNDAFDSLEKEVNRKAIYCGEGGIVSCDKGAGNIFINGRGPFTELKIETYRFINDGFPENEGKHRVQHLEVQLLHLSNNSDFKQINWDKMHVSIEAGVINLSGILFHYEIVATYNDGAYCHLVKSMVTRLGDNNENLLIIRYSEDVSEKYFVEDWYNPDGMNDDQKLIINQFKGNAEKAYQLKLKQINNNSKDLI